MAPASSEPRPSKQRVAVLGGNRIPFARSDGAYAEASNQDMFTAALGGLSTGSVWAVSGWVR